TVMKMLLLQLCVVLASVLLASTQLTPNNGTTTDTVATPVDPQPTPSDPWSTPPTAMQLVLATMFSGQYSNDVQHQDDLSKNVSGPNRHDLIHVTYIPVLVRILGSAVAFYHEQRVNNATQPVRQAIYAFTQESPCLVRMSTFDITNASRFSVTPEGLQALERLEPQDLANRPECAAFWEQIGDEFFTSYLSTDQCTFDGPGGILIRPDGSRNLTCWGMSFSEMWRRVPGGQVVGGATSPYLLQKIGNLYPVPVSAFRSNQCFNIPCTNNNSSKNSSPAWSIIKDNIDYAKTNESNNSNGV
ncbi:unnamed protein product, partial [Candidula unifasciata]